MRAFRFVATVLFVVSGCITSGADTLESPAEARQLTDRVMAKVGSGDLEAGLRLAKPYIIVPEAEFEVAVGQAKAQTPVFAQRFGKVIGSEYIRTDTTGESLLRIVHVARYENHAMRWAFYFYRGKSGWVLNTFKFDDDIRNLFPMP